MSGHSERRVNPPVGCPMSGGAGAPVGPFSQPACQPRSGKGSWGVNPGGSPRIRAVGGLYRRYCGGAVRLPRSSQGDWRDHGIRVVRRDGSYGPSRWSARSQRTRAELIERRCPARRNGAVLNPSGARSARMRLEPDGLNTAHRFVLRAHGVALGLERACGPTWLIPGSLKSCAWKHK